MRILRSLVYSSVFFPLKVSELANWSALLVFAFLSTACDSSYPAAAKQSPSAEGNPLRQVKTITVEKTPIERTVSVLGSLAAHDQATLSAKVPGRVARLTVDFGSAVEQGQLLAQIEKRDYQLQAQQAEAVMAQIRVRLGLTPTGTDTRVDPEQTGIVRQAQALLDEARQKRNRMAALVKKGFVAEAELDAAEADYKVALSRHQDALEEIRNRQALLLQRRSEFDLARQRVIDTEIHAPFDGVVQVKHTSVGEYLDSGDPVFTVVRVDPLRLRAEVPERAAYGVQAGQEVRVTVEGDPLVYRGSLTRIGATINEQTRMLTVEADVPNPGALRPGAFARVEIVTNEADPAITVPPSAVVSFAGVEKLLLVQEGKTVEREVSTGRRTDEWVEVLSGVQGGEVVIVEPGNLRPGQMVSVLR